MAIAAVARAIAGAAGRASGKKAASRAKRASDDVYNARRRFRRQAERYLARAEGSTGATKARYEAQARASLSQAMRSYQGGQPKGRIKQLADRLGMQQAPVLPEVRTPSESWKREYVQLSKRALSGARGDRDALARGILSIDNVGSRFYGGLVDIWGRTPETRRHPNRAIMQWFGADSMMDVLEELEEAGVDIYTPSRNDGRYESEQLKLQRYVLGARHGKA